MILKYHNNKWNDIRQRSRGYAAMAMVALLGMTALLTLLFVFRQGMRSHESQVRNQVKIDYHQKEDALLRALVAIVPNKAIGAMMPDSANNAGLFTWDQIFAEAIAASNAEGAISDAVIDSLGITGIISANTGDAVLTSTDQIVSVVAGDGNLVGPGNSANTGLLADAMVNDKLPVALDYSGNYSDDQTYPIISINKKYPSSAVGLGASATDYPLYNLIDYPNTRFGMSNQNGQFIAKRNWWAFSLTFGGGGSGPTSMPLIKRNFVLSIYEMPSQMALSAGAKLKIGAYGDGTAWQNTTIRGSIFAAEVDADSFNLLGSTARIAARRSITLNGSATVGGETISADFDALGGRETRFAAGGGDDYYGASLAGNSGRVAVLPLSQGELFIRRDTSVPQSNSVSDTGWYEYAMGGLQCAMQIEVVEMVNQRPVWVKFHYMQGGVEATPIDYKSSDGSWNNHDHDVPSNSPIPFYYENLGSGTPALTVNLAKIPDYLASLGLNAADRRANNSLSIWVNDGDPTLPQIPSVSSEMGVVLRQSSDLTGFTKGLSIVTDHRIYFAENFNQTAYATKPADAGLPAGEPYYPPVSVFAAEKRFGTNAESVDTIEISGQLTSLQDDDGTTVNPLDLKTTRVTDLAGETIAAAKMSADLSQLVSPAQLPPVRKMTWLVVVEEIHGSNSTVWDGDEGGDGDGDDDDDDDGDDD